MISDYRRGLLMALGTATLWGAASSIAKLTSAQGLSQLSVMAYRAVVVALLVGLWLFFRKGRDAFRISRRLLGAYVSLGFLTVVCTSAGFMLSCVYLPVPQALILHYTFPLVTIVGDFLITKERPTGMQIASAFLIVVGLYVGFGMGGGIAGSFSTLGVVWGVISVLGLSGQTLLTRVIQKDGKSDAIVQLFYAHLFGGAMVIVGKSLLMGWEDLAGLTPRIFLLIQYPTLCAGLIAFGLLFSALKYIPATVASLICTLEIVFGLALMPILLGIAPSLQEMAGAAVVLFAVGVATIKKK